MDVETFDIDVEAIEPDMYKFDPMDFETWW